MIKTLLILKIFLLTLMANTSDFYDFSFKSIDGNSIDLVNYKDKVVLLVNTASMCGFTKQYDGFQKLHEKLNGKGLVLIGLPSNSFMQEYSDESKVKDFCETKFNITFPMTQIINVIGEEKHPFYAWLKQTYGVKPRWNFYKILFDKKGTYIESFSSMTKPDNRKLLKMIQDKLDG